MNEDEASQKRLERMHADNREQAKAAWTNADNAVLKSTELAAQLSVQALRAPGFLNAAAVAALLGLLSANARALRGLGQTIEIGLVLFIVGAALSASAIGLAYFAQRLWTHELNDHTKSASTPYVSRNKRKAWVSGDYLFIAAVGFVLGSYAAFVVGSLQMLKIVRHISTVAI